MPRRSPAALRTAFAITVLLGTAGPSACTDPPERPSRDGEQVTYHVAGHAHRMFDRADAVAEDVSAALDRFELQAGEDGAINVSADGAWLLLQSSRFHADCLDWPCLVRVPDDLSAVEPVLAAGAVIHPEGFHALAPDGQAIFFTGSDGPHDSDIYVTRRTGGAWGAPVLLTGDSAHAFHNYPAVHADGSRLVFDCGPQSFGASGLCEVGADGSGLRELLMPSHVPPDMPGPAVALTHPYPTPDGAVVFEGDWDGERIWRLAAGAAEPEIVADSYTNDNSPCVLPGGRIASLWLNRPGNSDGVHELKIMAADGSSHDMRVSNLEIDDWGLGCGR